MWRVFLLAAVVSLTGCKFLSVSVDSEDEHVRVVVPWAVAKAAFRFSEGRIELDDLGGVDRDIDLKAIARALREDGDRVKLHIRDGNAEIRGEKRGDVFQICIDDPDEETRVRINMPMDVMAMVAEAGDQGHISSGRFMSGFRNYRGVLVEVESPDERVRIALK